MSVLESKINEVIQSLEILNIVGLDKDFVKNVLIGSIRLGIQCKISPDQVSSRMKSPRRLDEAYHERLIRRANNLGLTNDVEQLVLDAVYDCGINCTAEEIVTLRQEIND